MSKPKYLITNCVYGPIYSQIFLEQHLKSVLDETNLPDLAERYDIEYLILTDMETTPILQNHPNMQKLTNTVKQVSIFNFDWGKTQDTFGQRYNALLDLFKITVRKGIKDDVAFVTCWVADVVVAKNFFSTVVKPMEDGYDSVFVMPMRSAAESMIEKLNEWEGALNPLKLFKYAYENMHPLWQACHWENPLFSKLPFSLIWNNGRGLKVHSYSMTPIIFKPLESMCGDNVRGMIDGDVPALCENPFWATDWIDCPIILVEPLFCYYPPFENRPSSVDFMREWQQGLHHKQVEFMQTPLYYPSKQIVGEIDLKGIPEQITTGYTPPKQELIQPESGQLAGVAPAKAPAPIPLNRAQRRALERQGRK